MLIADCEDVEDVLPNPQSAISIPISPACAAAGGIDNRRTLNCKSS
ncbi:MAG TPA: hypothetical protein VGX92_00925 [Pyrinomonadaceae bacterium]|jgi:exonuclease I|nr:hypothetical protein [Pyrinomonadaceae bacterium]